MGCTFRSNWTLADLGVVKSSTPANHCTADTAVLTLDRLHVTSVDHFWSMVQAAHFNSTVSPEPVTFLHNMCGPRSCRSAIEQAGGDEGAQKAHQAHTCHFTILRCGEHVQLTGKAASGDDAADADLRLVKGKNIKEIR